MMIYVNAIAVVPVRFPGGEMHVNIGDPKYNLISHTQEEVDILAHIRSSDELMELLLITSAIRGINPLAKIFLELPYVPYARQDRIAVRGDPLSISVFADIINSQGYESVKIADPHSDVTSALIKRVCINHQHEFAETVFDLCYLDTYNTVIIAPDAGAVKKAELLAKKVGCPLITASKKRDPATGALSGTTIDLTDVPESMDLLIVDDIVDGGGTFMLLADAIEAQGKYDKYLYCTHGIFSKGTIELRKRYREIFCAYPFDRKTADVVLV